jgi:hypothetical protein
MPSLIAASKAADSTPGKPPDMIFLIIFFAQIKNFTPLFQKWSLD